ncbi:TPA: helix-turn-helix domain-containing protein [Legionella pneumophila]|nr:helix-turn-helix domain-containing protein [Legionella pneumophila]HEH5959003.1 helix-turn-helix domain-containing protein [Legionella pneumophila]
MDKKLNTNEAANYLGVKPKTLWEWRNRTPVSLPYYRMSKRKFIYLKSDLDHYLAQCRIDLDFLQENEHG